MKLDIDALPKNRKEYLKILLNINDYQKITGVQLYIYQMAKYLLMSDSTARHLTVGSEEIPLKDYQQINNLIVYKLDVYSVRQKIRNNKEKQTRTKA